MAGNFKEKYIETKPLGSEEVLTLVLSAPSSDCPLARAQECTQIVLLGYFSFAMFIEIHVMALWLFSPLSFYEEI